MTSFCKSLKSIRSIQTLLTVIVVAGVIALIPPLSPLPISASSDDSDTNAEQRLGEKNLGSGESDNENCDENLIDSAASVICIAEPPPPPPPPPPETATLSVCKEVRQFGSQFSPSQFGFSVTGNSPSPDSFSGDDSDGCVDVTIGPGEFTVSEVSRPIGIILSLSIEGECMQVPNQLSASGEIEAGETVECTFINSIGD
jgi:hypothetical protein